MAPVHHLQDLMGAQARPAHYGSVARHGIVAVTAMAAMVRQSGAMAPCVGDPDGLAGDCAVMPVGEK